MLVAAGAAILASCAARAKTPLGSSAKLSPDFKFGGVASDDPAINPTMAGWNHAVRACAVPVTGDL